MSVLSFISAMLLFLSLGFGGDVDDSKNDFLIRHCAGSWPDSCGYFDVQGNEIIPMGKYGMCYTDTFRSLAIVTVRSTPYSRLVGINRKEDILFLSLIHI